MIAPVLQVWSGPRCDPSAYPLAAIPPLTQIRLVETIAGSDDAGTLTLPRTLALACGVSEGRVLRAWWPARGTMEWPILRVSDSDPGDLTSVTLGTMRAILAWRDMARVLGARAVVTEFAAMSGTVADVLAQRVLTNLAEDGLSWLSAGVIETSAVYPWPTQSSVRRGEVLTLIEQVTGHEVRLRALAGDTGYAIDVLASLGGDAETRLVSVPWQTISRTRDLLQAATEVLPVGEDGQRMGEVDWVGGAAIGSGPYWIPLTDPTGGEAPIQEDGQCAGALLALPDGSTLPVLATRASDSAVQVAALGTYSTGQRVLFWESATGRPLSRLTSPSAIAERGVVSAEVRVKGARAERTLNPNPDFALGVIGWTPGTAGTMMDRADFDKTLVFAANGARGAGTGTGTPFAVDGLPALQKLYRGQTIEHTGAALAVSAAAIPNTSGVLSLSFTPGLPSNFNDDDPITLRRRELATMSAVHATPALSGLLFLQGADAHIVQRLAAFARVDVMGASGDLRVLGPGGEVFDENLRALYVHDDDDDVLVLRYAGYGGSAPPATDTLACTNVAVVSAHRLRVFVPTSSVTGTHALFTFRSTGSTSVPPWLVIPESGGLLTFAGTVAASGTVAGQPYLDIDILGLPSATDLTGLAGYVIDSTVRLYSGGWSGSFALRWLRETRTLRFSGAHTIGATTATFKAISTIQLRNWVGADQLRTVSGVFGVSGSASWASTGIATVPCVIPSGVTIRAGERVWSNWHGTGTGDTMMVAVATVVGPASSVQVRGSDAYRSNWDGVSTPGVACYQVPADSVLDVVGNTLVIAADAQADGSGAASLTLTAANANAIGDNAVLTITTPPMIPVGERQTGSALRLLFAPGGNPPSLGAGIPSDPTYITVPPGETVPVTAVMRVVVQPDTLGVGSAPLIAIVSAIGEQVRGTGTITGTTTYAERTVLTLVAHAELSQSGPYKIRLTGGSNSLWSRWHVVLDAQWYIGTETLPLFDGARSRASWQRAQRVLAQRASAARYQVRGLDLRALDAPLVLGQRVRIRSDALGIDTVQRLVRLAWQFPGGEVVDAECATIAPRLTDTTVSI